LLRKIVAEDAQPSALSMPVNSSHHQSADFIGDGLRIVARCPNDGIVEALEGTSSDHFVLAVQWHPEDQARIDPGQLKIFQSFGAAIS
jgi:putative glutamine amidotransferase